MKKLLIVAIGAFLLLPVLGRLAFAEDEGYSVTGFVTVGGGSRSSGSLSLDDGLGEPAIGESASESFDIAGGDPEHTSPPPEIDKLAAGPNPFSPNGDGFQDKMTASFSLNKECTVTVEILDGSPSPIRTLWQDRATTTTTTQWVVWDGKDALGAVVPNGAYAVRVSAVDGYGQLAQAERGIIVQMLVSEVSATPYKFSPNGDGFQDVTGLNATLTEEAKVTVTVLRGSTLIRAIKNATSETAGDHRYEWDGKNSSGVVQNDGSYTLRITARTALAGTTINKTVFLDNTKPVIGPVSVSPNPFFTGPYSRLKFSYTLSEPAYSRVEISDLSGLRYASSPLLQAAGSQYLIWNGRDSLGSFVGAGTYIYQVFVTDQAGNTAVVYPAAGFFDVF